ncbi:hypothetical protein [Streptosporangium sp. NPDC049644]|uniref:hypothetical protein n=1 Tax=Streptosporangium sp. NPDC049644 TaxID=3155507 RepID=UPI003419CD58
MARAVAPGLTVAIGSPAFVDEDATAHSAHGVTLGEDVLFVVRLDGCLGLVTDSP